MGDYIGVCVYRRSYLICPPGIIWCGKDAGYRVESGGPTRDEPTNVVSTPIWYAYREDAGYRTGRGAIVFEHSTFTERARATTINTERQGVFGKIWSRGIRKIECPTFTGNLTVVEC